MNTPLHQLVALGQSPWLDFIRRDFIADGALARMVESHALRGVTSNPAIFEAAISGSDAYAADIRTLAGEGLDANAIYERLAIADVQAAADVLRPVWEASEGADGFVSLEVSPFLARDTLGTITEARDLWKRVNRPNLMVKVPATKEGVPAIRQLIADGLNINVTLLFGIDRYRDVAWAFIEGLEERQAKGWPLTPQSVASFFVSRVDVMLDPTLPDDLKGQVAIANAVLAYEAFLEIFGSDRFKALAGARPQRVLWASTGTKNPAYPDVKYCDALVAPSTVNTMPKETLEAFGDHGVARDVVVDSIPDAKDVMARAAAAGVDIEEVAAKLEAEAIEKFDKPFRKLLDLIESKRAGVPPTVEFRLGDLAAAADAAYERFVAADGPARLWKRDGSLWSPDPEVIAEVEKFLGWTDIAEAMLPRVPELEAFALEVKEAGFTRCIVAGMGGSSLAPLVLAEAFGDADGLPVDVLDSTDPGTMLRFLESPELATTLVIVASKSGSTAEPNAFCDALFGAVGKLRSDPGQNFVAITDPGSKMEKLAAERGFRRTFLGLPSIGGRFSALSVFGLVPAAVRGVDLRGLLGSAIAVAKAPEASFRLGAAIAAGATAGRDKLTVLTRPGLESLGLWLEQLVAESTGKEGTGVLPIAGESVGTRYGEDRLFLSYGEAETPDGQPSISIRFDAPTALGAEFMRAELATAVVGALLGINPFDQPNVEQAKVMTRDLLAKVRAEGSLTQPASVTPSEAAAWLKEAIAPEFVGLLAYLTETPERTALLASLQSALRDATGCATTMGYGPRYLHSTGQYHKGGPNLGRFLVLVGGDARDAELPGEPFTFATFKNAQAFGDMAALEANGRQVKLVDLGSDADAGLVELLEAVR